MSFPQFSRLSPHIQSMIWRMAIPGPRIHDLSGLAKFTDESLQQYASDVTNIRRVCRQTRNISRPWSSICVYQGPRSKLSFNTSYDILWAGHLCWQELHLEQDPLAIGIILAMELKLWWWRKKDYWVPRAATLIMETFSPRVLIITCDMEDDQKVEAQEFLEDCFLRGFHYSERKQSLVLPRIVICSKEELIFLGSIALVVSDSTLGWEDVLQTQVWNYPSSWQKIVCAINPPLLSQSQPPSTEQSFTLVEPQVAISYREDTEWEVEQIMGCKEGDGGHEREFLVKWAGWGTKHNTWEPESNLDNCRDAIRMFQDAN